MTFRLFSAVPAVGANLALVKTDSLDKIVESVVAKRGKAELITDAIYHILIAGAIGIGILCENLVGGRAALKGEEASNAIAKQIVIR